MMGSTDRRSLRRGVMQAAVLPPAAFAVHELRYLLAFGGGAGAELQRSGHSYLHSVVPWLVALLALLAGWFLRALGRAFSGERSVVRYSLSFAGLWMACSAALIAIFVSQEFLEGLFATGHPAGLAGIFGYGGWWAVPAAACVGIVLAALFHGARWVLNEVVERCARSRPPVRRRRALVLRPQDALAPRLAPLADGGSGRGPPR
jgi:hypothetical protein